MLIALLLKVRMPANREQKIVNGHHQIVQQNLHALIMISQIALHIHFLLKLMELKLSAKRVQVQQHVKLELLLIFQKQHALNTMIGITLGKTENANSVQVLRTQKVAMVNSWP